MGMLNAKGFLFNQDRCIGCHSCEIACKNENKTATGVQWRRVSECGDGTFLSISCNHCSSPECFRVCPQHAYVKKRNGIVLINSNRCAGCMTCVSACPYKAPQFDPVQNRTSKCNYCVKRQEKGLLPACVSACPTGALQVLDLSTDGKPDMLLTVEGFPDTRLTKPSIRFYPVKPKKRYWITPQPNHLQP